MCGKRGVRQTSRLASKRQPLDTLNMRNQDEAQEPDWDDSMVKEQVLERVLASLERVPKGARMEVKIAFAWQTDSGMWCDVERTGEMFLRCAVEGCSLRHRSGRWTCHAHRFRETQARRERSERRIPDPFRFAHMNEKTEHDQTKNREG